ncbi:hypothetical protein ACOCMH_22725 [Cupriavidus sp. H39]
MIDKDMDVALSALVQQPGTPYAALRDSSSQTGYVNPLASDQAASDLAKMLASPRIRDVSHAQMPDRLKQNMGAGLTGTNGPCHFNYPDAYQITEPSTVNPPQALGCNTGKSEAAARTGSPGSRTSCSPSHRPAPCKCAA